jgi:hypothetical protein
MGIADKIRGRHLQSGGKPVDVGEADVTLASFHAADVCPVKTGTVGQRFLRDAQLLAAVPDGFAKGGKLRGSHASILGWMMTIRRQSRSSIF